MQTFDNTPPVIQRLLPLALLCVLLVLVYLISISFVVPMIWAAIIAYMTWPICVWLNAKTKRKGLSAFILTTSCTLLVVIPLSIGFTIVPKEALAFYDSFMLSIKNSYFELPEFATTLPVVGEYLQHLIDKINNNPKHALDAIQSWLQGNLIYSKEIADLIGTITFRALITMLTLFFLYRDGRDLLRLLSRSMNKILGKEAQDYFNAIGNTTQAVVYGIGLTAVAQAILAGIGYYVAGVPAVLMLTLVTGVLALIPFGAVLTWGSVAIYLFMQDQTFAGIGMVIWGTFFVSGIDNVLRPMLISGATQIPFMVILIGVLGGLSAFGFIGLFVGPVVLALAIAVWKEWLAHE